MSAFIRSPVCAYCACYLERRGRGRCPAMDIDPVDDCYPFYYYQRHLPLRNGLKRRVRRMEEAPFGISVHDADAPSVFVDRSRNPSAGPLPDGEILRSLGRRLEALEELVAGVKKQPTQSHNAPRSHRHSNPNALRSRQQAPQNPVKKTTLQAQKRASLRLAPDHAATIIQSRFRAYLVRRSQTLAHLRDLGVAKSTFKELNGLFADIGYRRVLYRDPDERRRFSERTLSLLLKVDSIPGSDRMVREARRSISKEIVGLLDAVEHLELRSTHGRRVRSKRPPKNQVDDLDASRVRTDIEGVCSTVAHVPIWGSRGACEHEAEEAAAAEAFERGGLGFGISCSSGYQTKRYDSKPPVFTFTGRGRGHGPKTWALPPRLQREIVELLPMSGFGFHFSSSPSFDCICDQGGFQ